MEKTEHPTQHANSLKIQKSIDLLNQYLLVCKNEDLSNEM